MICFGTACPACARGTAHCRESCVDKPGRDDVYNANDSYALIFGGKDGSAGMGLWGIAARVSFVLMERFFFESGRNLFEPGIKEYGLDRTFSHLCAIHREGAAGTTE